MKKHNDKNESGYIQMDSATYRALKADITRSMIRKAFTTIGVVVVANVVLGMIIGIEEASN